MESNRLFPRKRKRSFSCLASRGSLRSSWRFLEARIRPIWHGPRTVLLASGPCRSPLFLLVFPRTTEKRSEEHTSELQSRGHLVCRLLLEKKKSFQQCL